MAGYLPFQLSVSLTGDGAPEDVPGNYATREFFPILGIQPAMGRNFLPEEDVRNGDNAALISHGLWRRRYGADRNIARKILIVRVSPPTVVGALPSSFRFSEVQAADWM